MLAIVLLGTPAAEDTSLFDDGEAEDMSLPKTPPLTGDWEAEFASTLEGGTSRSETLSAGAPEEGWPYRWAILERRGPSTEPASTETREDEREARPERCVASLKRVLPEEGAARRALREDSDALAESCDLELEAAPSA